MREFYSFPQLLDLSTVSIHYTKAPEANYLDAMVITILQIHMTYSRGFSTSKVEEIRFKFDPAPGALFHFWKGGPRELDRTRTENSYLQQLNTFYRLTQDLGDILILLGANLVWWVSPSPWTSVVV